MALVKFGSTKCRLCDEILRQGDELVVVPAFIPSNHELFLFADSAYHQHCFQSWQHSERLQKLFESYRSVWDSRPEGLGFLEAEEWGKRAFEKVFG